MKTLILAVDSDSYYLNYVSRDLTFKGYEVITASDGKRALEQIIRFNPKIVITETVLPKMDGYELLKSIQLLDPTIRPKVIFLSNQCSDHSVFKGWRSGVDAYVTKPYNDKALNNIIQRILDPLE